MTADIITQVLMQFVVASVVFYFYQRTSDQYEKRIEKLDATIQILQSKLDACENDQKAVLQDMVDFYKVNTVIHDKTHKKAPESADSGAHANGT